MEDVVRTTTGVVDEKALKELRRTIEALAKRDPKFEERVTNKVDVLADRIETVARTVSTASASVVAKEGEMVQLRRELEAGLARANAFALETGRADPTELVEIKRTLEELSKLAKQRMPRGLESRVEELAAKFELVSQRIDSVSSTVSTTAAGLAGRDGDVNALRRTFEAERDRTTAELAELRRGIDTSAMADLRTAFKDLTDETARRQHGIQNLIGQAGAKVDAVAENVQSLSASLESSARRVSGTEQGLSAFRAYFDDARERLNALLAEHRQALVALSDRASALEQADAEATRSVDERLVDVATKLDHLAERLESSEQASSESVYVLDDRISAATDRIDDVVDRLEPLQVAVASAIEHIGANDGALQAMEERFQDATARVDGLVGELSRALAELPDANSVERALSARIDEVDGRTESLMDQIARMEASVHEQLETSTSAAEAERLREELSTVRRQFEESGDHLSSLVARQEQLLAELGARTSVLENADADAVREFDERWSDLRSRLGDLGRRLESTVTGMTSTSDRVSGTEEDVSALREYVEEAGTRLSSLLAEQARTLSALDSRAESLERADSRALSSLDERISATADSVDGLSSRLDSLVAQATDEVAERIEELAGKLREAGEERAETASEVARVAAILEVERASLRARLETLVVALETAPDESIAEELERRVARLTDRVEASDGERASFQAQFEAIATALASIPQHSSFERRLEELSRRLGEVEQRSAAVATKVSHASALLPTALRSLEARLDEVSPGPRQPIPEPDTPIEQAASDDGRETTQPVEIGDRGTAAVVPLRATDP